MHLQRRGHAGQQQIKDFKVGVHCGKSPAEGNVPQAAHIIPARADDHEDSTINLPGSGEVTFAEPDNIGFEVWV